MVCTYFLAAWAKIRFGGWEWATGSVLARAILRRGTELADLIAPLPGALIAAQIGILAFELASPLIFVLRGRWRYLAVAYFYSFHVMTYAMITISFAPHLVAMTAFLPLERVRPIVWLTSAVRGRVDSGVGATIRAGGDGGAGGAGADLVGDDLHVAALGARAGRRRRCHPACGRDCGRPSGRRATRRRARDAGRGSNRAIRQAAVEVRSRAAMAAGPEATRSATGGVGRDPLNGRVTLLRGQPEGSRSANCHGSTRAVVGMCRSTNRAQALQNAQSPSNRNVALGSARRRRHDRRCSAPRWTRVVLTPSWCTVIDRYAVPRPPIRGDSSHITVGRGRES